MCIEWYIHLIRMCLIMHSISSALRALPATVPEGKPCTPGLSSKFCSCIFWILGRENHYFYDFGRSKLWFLGHFGRPGAHCGGPGAHIENFEVFGDVPARKTTSKGMSKLTLFHFLWGVEFYMFFWVLFFIVFFDFMCPEAPFWLPFSRFFGNLGPVKKQQKLWYCHVFSRFGPFQVELFYVSWWRVRFDLVFL